MIRINLLPVRQMKKRAKSRNEVIILIVGFVVLLLALTAVGFGQIQKISGLNSEIKSLNKEKQKYAAVIKQIKKIEAEKAILEKKLQVIKDLQTTSQIPVRVLDEIAKITPSARIWLKSLNLKASGLVISGTALDNETIAQYMLRIMESPYFSKAELKNSSMTNVNGQKLKSFGMNISIQK
jgi:type IV pilus assembly protein PilN